MSIILTQNAHRIELCFTFITLSKRNNKVLHNHPYIKLLTLYLIRAAHAAAVRVTATVSRQREAGKGMEVQAAFLCALASSTCDGRTLSQPGSSTWVQFVDDVLGNAAQHDVPAHG